MSEAIETKTMFVWNVELEIRFDYEDPGDWTDVREFNVAATSYEEALEKATGVAMQESFEDAVEDGGDGSTCHVIETRLISIKRGDELDA